MAVTMVLAAIAAGSFYLYTRDVGQGARQTTTDAYVAADSTFVAPKIAGLIAAIMVEDNQNVRKGDLLATIDARDFVVAVANAQADVDDAWADVQRLRASVVEQDSVIQQSEAAVAGADASVAFAQANNKRYANLSADGSGTVQEQQQADAQFRIATARRGQDSAGCEASKHHLAVLLAEQKQAEARVAKMTAVLDAAKLNLSYTRIVAPIDGTIGARSLRVGGYVHVGTPLLAVVPLQRAYVEANFRETQLERLRSGEAVTIKIDMLPGTQITGHVESVAPTTGIAFSPIAPDNATGNFTKVVQRLPVKIIIDPGQPVAQLLRVGMSVVPTVYVDSVQVTK